MTTTYLNSYFEIFVSPLVRILNIDELNAIDLSDKRKAMDELLVAVVLHQDTQHQWTSDEEDEKCWELERLLINSTIPEIELPLRGRVKLYYDLEHLNALLTTDKLYSDELSYIIRELLKCTPHSATHYELLLASDRFIALYNRLMHLMDKLERSDFDDNWNCYSEIVDACANIKCIGDEEMVEIPDTRDAFISKWGINAFDEPRLMYPKQNMYRSVPFIKTLSGDWLFAHREQLKYMSGYEFWQRSPTYGQLDASVRFAFYNYPDMMETHDDLARNKGWDLEKIVANCHSRHIAPNQTFKDYYDELVEDFCDSVGCIDANRSCDHACRCHLSHIYKQASKIRTMSEWMLNGIDGVCVDRFISRAYLEPTFSVKLIPPMPESYRKLIDYFAYIVCMDDGDAIEKKNTICVLKSFI